MFKNILIPLDGSDLAEGILPHVRTMATAFGARVTLLRVSEASDETGIDMLDWHLQKAEAEAYLRERADVLRQAGLSVETQLLEGPAAERIVAYADQQQADMIVLSSHGRGGLSRWNVSHIAQKVLQRGTTSILLVPADHTEPDDADAICYRRILVPLDGSRRAECVLPFAGVLAGQPETQLLLAHVTPRPFVFHRLPPSDNENASMEWLIGRNRARAALYLKEVAARIGPGADTTLPVSDSIELALHQLVADEAVDLVLFSAHGQSGQSQWPYGSVVSNFITNGSAPLLIVQDMPQALDQQSPAQTRGAYSATVWSEVNGRAF